MCERSIFQVTVSCCGGCARLNSGLDYTLKLEDSAKPCLNQQGFDVELTSFIVAHVNILVKIVSFIFALLENLHP
jgi:hypothetical protein